MHSFCHTDVNLACKLGSRVLSESGFTGFTDFQDLETIEKNEVFSLDYRFDDVLHKRYVSIKKHANPGDPIILKILVQTFVGFRELNQPTTISGL